MSGYEPGTPTAAQIAGLPGARRDTDTMSDPEAAAKAACLAARDAGGEYDEIINAYHDALPWKRKVQIGDCTLYQGDCRELLPIVGPVDAVVTDPPYGIGAAKKNAQSSIRDSLKWPAATWDDARPSADAFNAILSCSAEQIIWGGNYFADLLPARPGWLSWRKPQAETGFSLADIELAWTSFSSAARQKTLPRRDGHLHPTQKPVALMEWCLSFLPKARIILDPFMGSGTTLVACAKLGRKGIGIDIDPGYFDTACKRVEEAYRQGDMFIERPAPSKQEELL